MKKTFETELPQGYAPILTVDAGDKKTETFLNVFSAILTVGGIVIGMIIFRPTVDELFDWKYLIVIAVLLVYVVLHELVHGLAYKLLTGKKLVFGLKESVAYCGVPDIFVYRTAALISLLAPFTVFIVVFLLGAILLPGKIDRFYSAMLLAFHVGGCAGDLFDTWLYLTKLKDPSILSKDSGPKQIFYGKTDTAAER